MNLPVILIIWIIIRDAQMFQRAPRRKFKRLDPYENFDYAEFEDRFQFTKEEMRSDKFTLTPVRWSHPCEMITMLDRKKSYQKRYI